MRILVHDYAGHPFQIQLSRWLAESGNEVLHCYSGDVVTPRGNLGPSQSRLEIRSLSAGRSLRKYNLAHRLVQENLYAAAIVKSCRDFSPDVVLSANTPPTIQRKLLNEAHRGGSQFIYWLQDIFSPMLGRVLGKRMGLLGRAAESAFGRFEYSIMARCDATIVISDDFVKRCVAGGVPANKIHIIQNWAPLNEIVVRPRDNHWSARHGLNDKFVFLFSGTLGLKHNPVLLVRLAESVRGHDKARVVVITEGLGRQYLEKQKVERKLDNLLLFDFQPFEDLSDVLASGDVLIAILESFAGELSVPSKILSYMCSFRPMLAALPSQNLASRIVVGEGAGLAVTPEDEAKFVEAARVLMSDEEMRNNLAASGRHYAEKNFDIERIGRRFLEVFNHR